LKKSSDRVDPVEEVPAIQNDSEMNVFYDYFSLYRIRNGKRFVCDWLMRNPGALTSSNEALVMVYTEARFSVMRVEKNLVCGAIQVVDVISQKPYILIDKALNNSKKDGCFFCCSIIDRNDYIMTTGVGILIDGRSLWGRGILTVGIDQLKVLKDLTVLTT